MKRVISLSLIIMAVLFLFGCTNEEQAEIHDKFMEDISKVNASKSTDEASSDIADMKSELNLYTMNPDDPMSIYPGIIERFNEKFPDVKVNLVGPTRESDDNYELLIAVTLMSGEKIDLVDLLLLPNFKYAKNGMFADLYQYMKNDPKIIMEEYYTNIFEAFEYNGSLYSMPFYFYYPACRLNNKVLQALGVDANEIESVDFNQIYEWYSLGIERGIASPDMMISKHEVNHFFDLFEFTAFLDERIDKVSFDSPEFIRCLEKVKNSKFPESESPGVGWIADFNEANMGR